jgi:hypothetical protein
MSEGRRKWSEMNEEEVNEVRRYPARRISAPGLALIIVGCLGLLANCLVGGTLNVLRQDRGPVERPAGMDDDTFRAYERGRATAPFCLVFLSTSGP